MTTDHDGLGDLVELAERPQPFDVLAGLAADLHAIATAPESEEEPPCR
jgi:hypothetical protein